MNELVTAQKDCIESSIGRAIKHLLNHNTREKTLVLPLAIPTGFGKTRISIQGIVNTVFDSERNISGSVILWPQKKAHITNKDAWVSNINWVDEPDKIEKEERFDGVRWQSLLDISKKKDYQYKGKNFFYILKSPDKWNAWQKKRANKNLKGSSRIFVIIDEWHNKKLIDRFFQFSSEISDPSLRAEEFWRKTLLPESMQKKKLFVLLVSATPISVTADMDERTFDSDSDNVFFQEVQTAYEAFKHLTRLGYKRGDYNFLENAYNTLIKKEVGLLAYNENYQIKDCVESYLDGYLNSLKYLAKKKLLDDGQIYLHEQEYFAKEENGLKIEALLDLLKRKRKKKFLIFCSHINVAKSVVKQISDCFGKETTCYSSAKGIYSGYSYGKIRDFFNETEHPLKYLVVTDKDSQGIDLHRSGADIVHYELSWNPIRIIQRFGRVWRIIRDANKNVHMTCPKAYHIPYTYSSEEEQLNRLDRRWKFLEKLDEGMASEKRKNKKASMTFAAIPMKIALGIRVTPKP